MIEPKKHIKISEQFLNANVGLTVLLWASVLLTAILVCYMSFENRQKLQYLNELKKLKIEKNVEYGQLLIEESMLSTPVLIEPTAKQKFNMRIPQSEQLEYVDVSLVHSDADNE